MGSHKSKLKKKSIEDLSRKTNLSTFQIAELHKSFLKDYPKGKLTVNELGDIYQKFFPKGDIGHFTEHIFSTFDENGDGYVDFSEMVIGIAVFQNGTVKDKLRWAFSMYDLDRDGQISRNEMLEVVTGIYKMVGNSIDVPEHESTPEKRVDMIFKSVDIDENGSLSLDEFIEAAQMDDTLVSIIKSK